MPERGDDDVVPEKKLKRIKSEVTRLEKRRQRQLRPDMIAKYRGMDLEGEDGVRDFFVKKLVNFIAMPRVSRFRNQKMF